MIRKLFLYFVFIFIYLGTSKAQEIVTGLQSNSVISAEHKRPLLRKDLAIQDTIDLPFFDDFSGLSVFPDSRWWLDNYVYINNTYSDHQITKGIATFDALDNTGSLYATASTSEFEADHLTSKPVNLNYTTADNIWLSFFYEPGGLSDPPEEND
jgi:hypothetical protein